MHPTRDVFTDTPMRGTPIAHCMCIDRRDAAVQAEKVVVGESGQQQVSVGTEPVGTELQCSG